MEITLFSKCVKDLIVENDRVDVPYLGTFSAELIPAAYSDHQTTIHPPYRKMSFHKHEVSQEEGRPLLEKVMKEAGVSLEQAGVELGWCLSRICSELEGRKNCVLPGLGVMKANSRNEFFFVPDDNLDIWPDGIGLETISIKVSEEEMPDQVRHDEEEKVENDKVEQVEQEQEQEQEVTITDDKGEAAGVVPSQGHFSGPETKPQSSEARKTKPKSVEARKKMKPGWIVLIVLGVLAVAFVLAAYLFPEQLSPILDPLLYTKEELELMGR